LQERDAVLPQPDPPSEDYQCFAIIRCIITCGFLIFQ
jgi:hypothetical protein